MIDPFRIDQLEKKIVYKFKDKSLLQEALTHKSFANEKKILDLKDNERFEFLGDAILDFVISDLLFKKFPDLPEGDLTKKRSNIVREEGLFKIGKSLDLGEYMLLGKGEILNGGSEKRSLIANVTEALIASIFLDGGIKHAYTFIENAFSTIILTSAETMDYKSELQELSQKNKMGTPVYRIAEESGPDHNKQFKIALELGGKLHASGYGKSIKEAEQAAAKKSLEIIS